MSADERPIQQAGCLTLKLIAIKDLGLVTEQQRLNVVSSLFERLSVEVSAFSPVLDCINQVIGEVVPPCTAPLLSTFDDSL